MWSLAVFMYTRGTAFTALSVPSLTWPNLAVLRAAGHGRSRMDASVESCRNVCSWWIARWCSSLSATLVGGRSSPRLNFRSYTSPNSDKSGKQEGWKPLLRFINKRNKS